MIQAARKVMISGANDAPRGTGRICRSRDVGCRAARLLVRHSVFSAVRVRSTSNSYHDCKNHALSVELHYMHYNFCRIHKTPRITPAMAAGVTDRLWSVGDTVKVLEIWENTT